MKKRNKKLLKSSRKSFTMVKSKNCKRRNRYGKKEHRIKQGQDAAQRPHKIATLHQNRR